MHAGDLARGGLCPLAPHKAPVLGLGCGSALLKIHHPKESWKGSSAEVCTGSSQQDKLTKANAVLL